MFQLESPFQPAGDQPKAIEKLTQNLNNNERNQVLLGVTGSGKTFTMANVIQTLQRPTLIMAPNKILAAQLHSEMQGFFPHNAVEYFVSYYDFYQPEAYLPTSDTYIEKTAKINDEIDRMRHAATRALLERRDVILVASVSCIYGIGQVETYGSMVLDIHQHDEISMHEIMKKLVELQYKRADFSFTRGTFRVSGDTIDIFPPHYDDYAWRISFFGDEIESIHEIEVITCHKLINLGTLRIYANSHYATPQPTLQAAIKGIRKELGERFQELETQGKLLEAQRLKQRTEFDIEMIIATGMCNGIENYSRYLTGRSPGEPPPTLFEYLPKDALLIVDESHVAVPQVYGMYNGDRARKMVLIEHGFRLPSCADNRPLKGEEWEKMRPQTIFVSATPGPYELELGNIIEQIVRPTGLVDPICTIKPCEHQVDDLMEECQKTIAQGYRILVTTLTKKMAEGLTDYLVEMGMKVQYLHSDIKTLERIEIIQQLRRGEVDILVGINLLREGLDIPEVGLVAILDADKAGFLRSQSSLIQTIGRAARNVDGRVILYADRMTAALEAALNETDRRREKQTAFNAEHGITPKTTFKKLILAEKKEEKIILEDDIEKLKKMMKKAAQDLDFERAAELRDRIKKIELLALEVNNIGMD